MWKEPFCFVHQIELIQRKLTNGLFLGRVRSNVFEYDQAHSLIEVFVSRAIFEIFYE